MDELDDLEKEFWPHLFKDKYDDPGLSKLRKKRREGKNVGTVTVTNKEGVEQTPKEYMQEKVGEQARDVYKEEIGDKYRKSLTLSNGTRRVKQGMRGGAQLIDQDAQPGPVKKYTADEWRLEKGMDSLGALDLVQKIILEIKNHGPVDIETIAKNVNVSRSSVYNYVRKLRSLSEYFAEEKGDKNTSLYRIRRGKEDVSTDTIYQKYKAEYPIIGSPEYRDMASKSLATARAVRIAGIKARDAVVMKQVKDNGCDPSLVIKNMFSDYPELLKELEATAKREFRTLESQILFELHALHTKEKA